MGLMDKVKAQANQLAQQANQGMAKIDQSQHNRRADAMFRNLGVAEFADRTGRGTPETPGLIDKLVADISAHEAQFGVNLAQTGEAQWLPGGGGAAPGQAQGFPGQPAATGFPPGQPDTGFPPGQPAATGFPGGQPAATGFPPGQPAATGFPPGQPPAGYQQPGYPSQASPAPGYPQADPAGYPQAGYQSPPAQAPGFPQGGLSQAGFPPPPDTSAAPGAPQQGFPQAAYQAQPPPPAAPAPRFDPETGEPLQPPSE